jgi:hypothetical protein
VSLSTGLAVASPLVTTDVIMVNLFPYLAVRYQADDVPTTAIDGRKAIVGVVDEAEYVARVVAGTAR